MLSDSGNSFVGLGLDTWLCHLVQSLGWSEPSPIQSSAIPVSLNGLDVIGIAETGSGKTAAFLLPIIQAWIKAGRPSGFALLLVPTRELAKQLSDEAIRLGRCDSAGSINQELNVRVVRLVGGEDMVEQALQLAWHRHHMIVATPGRLVDHIRQTPNFAQQQLACVRHLVLDEADRMLNMAFADDLDTILDHFRRPASNNKKQKKKRERRALDQMSLLDRISQAQGGSTPVSGRTNLIAVQDRDKFPHPQTYLYSATMTKDVIKLRRAALSPDAVLVSCMPNLSDTAVGNTGFPSAPTTVVQAAKQTNTSSTITTKTGFPSRLAQYCLPIRSVDKPAVLDWILEHPLPQHGIARSNKPPNDSQTIVFCKRCQEARLVCGFLCERGHLAVPLTGRMKHAQRKQAMADFLNRKARILVATDVASRGLDMPDVQLVINYSVPLSEKTYRHRIGRTARAGQPGVAVTLVTRDVAHSFLELEASIGPYLPRLSDGSEQSDAPCIPRWPVQLPGPSGKRGMLSRRRLADEAWSKASKLIRTQDAERRKALSEDQDGSDYDDDDDEAEEAEVQTDETDEAGTSQSDSVEDTDHDGIQVPKELDDKPAANVTAHGHLSMTLTTSGLAGIQAARQTWRALAREKRKRHRKRQAIRDNQRDLESKGWGLRVLDAGERNGDSQSESDDDGDDITDTDHLRFEETLKAKYAKISTTERRANKL
ncbi:putative ATP-dependent RNA helicase DDX47 [Fasciola gigantica]|uniref:RNA helicase n=1 Tax=Fasciola gigantica TaxID=46835 RepID=A0A504YR96_FASGI|nr:putative ATP-dependent RNA helicase DDX47 [Fasciola gigantica]